MPVSTLNRYDKSRMKKSSSVIKQSEKNLELADSEQGTAKFKSTVEINESNLASRNRDQMPCNSNKHSDNTINILVKQ